MRSVIVALGATCPVFLPGLGNWAGNFECYFPTFLVPGKDKDGAPGKGEEGPEMDYGQPTPHPSGTDCDWLFDCYILSPKLLG